MILNRCGVLFFFESKIMGNGELTFKFWGVNLEEKNSVDSFKNVLKKIELQRHWRMCIV